MTMTQDELRVNLLRAANNGDLAKVGEIVAAGIKVDLRGDFGNWHPLHFAAMRGHLPVVEFLVGKGAPVDAVNEFGAHPLHCAVEEGHMEVAGFLLENGADPMAKDIWHKTPLDYAIPHYEIGDLLRKWSDPALREKRQAAIIRAHWKRVAARLPAPGPGL